MLASSDYEGTVTLWDAFTGVKSKIFQVVRSFFLTKRGSVSRFPSNVYFITDMIRGVGRYFQEHEKRCWSVDFNKMDPKLLASGSDDSKG